jgi:hypothetical protein
MNNDTTEQNVETVWIKWWKDKNMLTIVLTSLLAVISGLLCALYICMPYNLVAVGIICIAGGIIIRKNVSSLLQAFADKMEAKIENQQNN